MHVFNCYVISIVVALLHLQIIIITSAFQCFEKACSVDAIRRETFICQIKLTCPV